MSTAGEIMAVNADLMQIATTIKNEWKRASEKRSQFGSLWFLAQPRFLGGAKITHSNILIYTFLIEKFIIIIKNFYFELQHLFDRKFSRRYLPLIH